MALPPVDRPPLLEVAGLHVTFRSGGGWLGGRGPDVRAVDGVDLTLGSGEALGLVGESGSGKTTVGRAILRLIEPTAGRVAFDGVDLRSLDARSLRRMRRRFQMIFQDPYSSLNPRMTVGRIIREPFQIHGIAHGEERERRVRRLLDEVGMSASVIDQFPHEFSGGQRQRVGIARALAVEPELLVADEPISALDVSIRAQILELLQRIQGERSLAFLVIAHDLAAVRRISHRVAVMYLGRIVEIASASTVYRSAAHPYTVALLSAVPIPDPAIQRRRRRIILVGDVPSPTAIPSGCRFHTRCWLYTRLGQPERCRTDDPALRPFALGQSVACHYAEQTVVEAEQAARSPSRE